MQLLGFELASWLVGALVVLAGLTLLLAVLTIAGVIAGALSVLVFKLTRKVIVPRVTLFLLSVLEVPIKYALWIFRIDEAMLEHMIIQIRNTLYLKAYAQTPFNKRAIFLPQCLRSPNCPAKLTPEGIKCIECGQCGIGEVKKLAEDMGYMFFIVPGSSFIKRMIKQYKPEAILGVGCPMEVKEGTAMMASVGLPVQGVELLKDGCVDTRVDVKDLVKKIHLTDIKAEVNEKEVEKIEKSWSETPRVYIKIKK